MTTALEFRDVDILFAGSAGARGRRAMKAALALLDQGRSRNAISDQTGVILGVCAANLTVQQGEICVLMGLSGSGKSTLLRAANGLNTVTRGHVLVRNGMGMVDVSDCDDAALRKVRRERVAMVFQQFGLLPWRTVRENVGFGLELRGAERNERRRVVDEKLELVGLSQWADRYASELSGGMQQRVGLARAFATDADILLMDEPFSALDPLIRSKLQNELLALQERMRKTILFVSHDLDEALKLGDRISIMEGGRIIQTGSADDIMLRPADDYVAEFVAHMNPLTVLTGSMIMRRLEQLQQNNSAVLLDGAGRYQLTLDQQGAPLALTLDAKAYPLAAVADDGVAEGGRVTMADAGLSLRTLIDLRQASGHPIVLLQDGAMAGVCCQEEILMALSAGRSADRHAA